MLAANGKPLQTPPVSIAVTLAGVVAVAVVVCVGPTWLLPSVTDSLMLKTPTLRNVCPARTLKMPLP